LPQLILFDGATGSGKSSLLKCLRNEYSLSVLVGAKLTTRQKREGDNDWEFRFVDRIPAQYSRYSFNSVGNHYAVDPNELENAIRRPLVYAISLVDQQIMEILRSDFDTVIIYLYRLWEAEELEALLSSRGASDHDSQLRRDEVASIASEYLEKIKLYDHVVLNIGAETDMINQMSKILQVYGIARDDAADQVEKPS
jgi:guanylate kinase